MATDADLEYGPTPENAEHEHTDIEPTLAVKFAVWLVISIVISGAIVYGTFWLFEDQEVEAQQEAQVFPLAVGPPKEPTGPQLQKQPFKDIYNLREGELQKLTTYGWVDEASGTVRIPIDDAIRLMEQRGMLASRPVPPGANEIVLDSSAGRVTVKRP